MQIIKSPKILHHQIQILKKKGKSVGFVPTMGALHEGHLSLIRKARQENDVVVLSVFVNPVQFGPQEDFKKYPRPIQKDCRLARKEKVDVLFLPSPKAVFSDNPLTYVYVEEMSKVLCGVRRKNHFRGVATIVAKLLNIVSPDRMYLGKKDAQQAIILRKMVADLNYFVRIKLCSTVREKDGLALSSRNAYLSTEERRQAPVLYQSLKKAHTLIRSGERRARVLKKNIQGMIDKTEGKVEYIEIVDEETLKPLQQLRGNVLIALAVRFGKTRLIDNKTVKVQ